MYSIGVHIKCLVQANTYLHQAVEKKPDAIGNRSRSTPLFLLEFSCFLRHYPDRMLWYKILCIMTSFGDGSLHLRVS